MRKTPVTDDDQKRQMAQLEERIAAARKPEEVKSHNDEHYNLAHLAWRMVIELVVGLGIGFGVGYGLDRLLGTIPIFLVLFTLLGMAAGIKTMMRSAAELQKDKLAEQAAELDEKERTSGN
ncbi:MAG: ATP synthase protein I [Paracoccaceae bacterium]